MNGLGRSLFSLVYSDWLEQAFFQLLSSCSLFLAPLALERILWSISTHNNNNGGSSGGGGSGASDDESNAILPFSLNVAVVLLFVGPVCKAIGDGQNYSRGRHIGVTTRAALVSAIYDKVLRTDLTLLTEEGSGNLSNLISVDAG
eukprot:gene48865-65518_t